MFQIVNLKQAECVIVIITLAYHIGRKLLSKKHYLGAIRTADVDLTSSITT